MAYPFLPVNPCCTDVVINDPCGCSSTITNSGCNSNDPCSTNLTASSTIAYDGPALSCIIAEPCDTLNVILQKIDEIICNLLTQINILTIQVNNITTQIINIEGDIINIDNSLDACCNTTTSTTTTAAIPCQGFSLNNTSGDPVAIIVVDCATGLQTAIILPPGESNVCVDTGSPVSVPVTVIVTPTGPCTPSTTTTTTTLAINCTFTGTAEEITSTTTTTTTVALDCEFTGSATEVTTTTTTTAIPTTTTTSSSTSSTTSSTTTAEPTTTTTSSSTSTSTSTSTSSSTTTSTTAVPTTTTTTSLCVRPGGLVTVSYFNTYTYDDIQVDYTGSLLDACNACNFIKNNIIDIQQETSLFGQSGSFNIGQYVYAGLVTDCLPLANGFYITDHEFCEIAEIVDGYIVDITNCEIIPTTTTTSTTCNPAETHDYFYQPIRGTNLIPDFISSLVDACSSQICLQNTTCSIDFSYLVYFNVPVPGIGDRCYSSTIGCIVGLVNDGYYIIDYSGTYTIVEIIDSTIVSFPICSTTTTTTTVAPTTTSTTTSTSSPQCYNVEVYPPVFNPGTFHTVEYLDCLGDPQTVNVPDGGSMVPICATEITSNNNNGATNALLTPCIV